LARRERNGHLAICSLLLLSCGGLLWGQQQSLSLDAAREALDRGDNPAALDLLRAFRDSSPDSAAVDESYALGVKAALAEGDQYLARYFARKLVTGSSKGSWTFQSCVQVAQRAYLSRSYDAALEFYLDAVVSFDAAAAKARRDFDMALLRSAELCLYQQRDAPAARTYLHQIEAENIPSEQLPLLRTMRVRLAWDTLSSEKLGLSDANVSALRVDEDDLWVTTWNGGVARYSVSAQRAEAFPVPSSPRSIEIATRRVWVGSTEGLAWYGKAKGNWGAEQAFQVPSVRQVQALKLVGGALYAGTLGDGLFRLSPSQPDAPSAAPVWSPVTDGELPGASVTCLEEPKRGASLYIGTLSHGLVVMDRTGAMKRLSDILPSFSASNVTSVHEDSAGRVWIATYGDGLYLWMPATQTLQHFTKSSGQLGDDWVMAIAETDRALYFGTFGGGVSALQKSVQEASWHTIGIRDGLASLDVSAIAWRSPYVFFGTLGAGVSVYDEEADAP
jgi:hypothetical protein